MLEEEWQLRVELAACYRIADYMDWGELIYNHITMRMPGPKNEFLINPYGLRYDEVTASNLLHIDQEGKILGDSNWPMNSAGFTIHSAIHESSPDAHCILHTHTTAGCAVAAQTGGLRMESIYASMLYDKIAYHDFEGVTVRDNEKPRLVKSLGDKSYLILRNHGLLTVGKTIPEAFLRMWHLNRACEIQISAGSSSQSTISISEKACKGSVDAWESYDSKEPHGARQFAAYWRLIEDLDLNYKT